MYFAPHPIQILYPFHFIDLSYTQSIMNVIVYPVMDVFFFIIAVFTYSTIIYKLNNSKKSCRRAIRLLKVDEIKIKNI